MALAWLWPGIVTAAMTEKAASRAVAKNKQARVRSLSFKRAWSRCSMASFWSGTTIRTYQDLLGIALEG